MTRFQTLYKQILEGSTSTGDICTAHPDFRCPVTRPGFSDDVSFILNETIKSVELTPVPDKVLYEILQNLKKNKNVYRISYKKIIEIINQSEYALSETFSKYLTKYANNISGNLYVILCDLNDFEKSKVVLTELQKQLHNDERLYQVLNVLQNQNVIDLQGLTVIKQNIQFEKYKDCFIILNQKDNWKDTLEHEFKHFIQRVCSFDKSLPKIVKNDVNDSNSIQILNHFKSKGFTSNELRQLMNFLMFKTSKTEQHQSITSLIKFFIRKYETTTEKFEINHKMLTIKQIEGLDKNIKIKVRMEWLTELLNKINSFKVFDYQIIKNYLNDRSSNFDK